MGTRKAIRGLRNLISLERRSRQNNPMSLKLNFYKTALRKKAAKGFDGYGRSIRWTILRLGVELSHEHEDMKIA